MQINFGELGKGRQSKTCFNGIYIHALHHRLAMLHACCANSHAQFTLTCTLLLYLTPLTLGLQND